MNRTMQLVCAWCAPVFLATLVIGYGLAAHFIPPPSAGYSAQQVAQIFRDRTGEIRAGMLLMMVGSLFLVPWNAVIFVQVKRIEGARPVLAYTQLIAGALLAVEILLPSVMWSAIAFRPERAPEITQMVSDTAFLLFIWAFAPPMMQALAIALAIFNDKGPDQVFPRWAGYLLMGIAVGLIPGGLITFFKTGPFAWDGAIGWWLTLACAGTMWSVMTYVLIRAVKNDREPEAEGAWR
jgi:hypothetical protein